jgi:hypothetical protein
MMQEFLDGLRCFHCTRLPEVPRRCPECEQMFCKICIRIFITAENCDNPDQCPKCKEAVSYDGYVPEEMWWAEEPVCGRVKILEKFFLVGIDEDMTGFLSAKKAITVSGLVQLLTSEGRDKPCMRPGRAPHVIGAPFVRQKCDIYTPRLT